MRIAAGSIALLVCIWGVLTVATLDPWPSNDGLTVALLLVMGGVGVVVVRKLPRNAVGWLFVATVLIGLVDTVARQYLVLDYRQHDGRLPLGVVAADWRNGTSISAFLVALPTILLFPDGTVPSRRWRGALSIYVVLASFFTVAQFAGAALASYGPHPVIDIRGNVPNVNAGTVAGGAWLLAPFFLGFWLASVVHQARAWRQASGERREQLKWLAAGAAVCIVSSVALQLFGDGLSLTSRLVADLAVLGIAAFPVGIGVGILKYRLYEIDRLVSRTISYAVVTGVLVGVFVGLVVLTTGVLPFSSPVGVAASTLVAAALFNPLRLRVQRVVDRRFNRARYDAEATVEAFVRRLRDAVDVEAVQAGFAAAVNDAVEPTHLTVWLRSPVSSDASRHRRPRS